MNDKDIESSISRLSQLISGLRGVDAAESALLASDGFIAATSQLQQSIRISQEKFDQNIADLIKIHKFLRISLKKSEDSSEIALTQLTARLEELLRSIDTSLSALIEEYTILLNDELEYNKKRLFSEKSDTESIRKEANIFRQIKFFAETLSFTSQAKATMTFLQPTSIQYEKCEKAFMENIHPDLQRKGFSNHLQVFQIIHIQNQYLSSLLQGAVESVSTTGRVKGVFCLLPFDYLRHFAAFGLYLQEYHQLSPIQKDMLMEWYLNPWHSPIKSESIASPIDLLVEIQNQPSTGILQFSNCSTPASATDMSVLLRNNVLCIALCRVLTNNALVVTDDFVDDDIDRARRENYDFIYDSSSGEYCFINPEQVLPEFFIFARYDSSYAEEANIGIEVKSNSRSDQTQSDRREVLAKKQAVIAKVHDLLKSAVTKLSEKLMEEFQAISLKVESK